MDKSNSLLDPEYPFSCFCCKKAAANGKWIEKGSGKEWVCIKCDHRGEG